MHKRKRAGNTIIRKINSTKDTAAKADKNHYIIEFLSGRFHSHRHRIFYSLPKYTESGVPFISVKDISGGFISFTNAKKISLSEHEELYKRCDPKRGDILLTKVGTTGIPALVDTDIQFSLFVSVALLRF